MEILNYVFTVVTYQVHGVLKKNFFGYNVCPMKKVLRSINIMYRTV